ncbi:MAG: hypothetical protein V2I97_10730 [Desulfococcaceae bacterium]|jgi:hypothetical protein|nr:hypothetical protein [Desulfococcaceae bacterium]
MPPKAEAYDHMERRCPRLGGPVTFRYCRECPDTEGFCPKTADCWWEYFDVMTYLKTHLSEKEFNELSEAKFKPKVSSLLEIIQQLSGNSKQ